MSDTQITQGVIDTLAIGLVNMEGALDKVHQEDLALLQAWLGHHRKLIALQERAMEVGNFLDETAKTGTQYSWEATSAVGIYRDNLKTVLSSYDVSDVLEAVKEG